MTPTKIVELQTRLTELGYQPGPIDGQYGNKTEAAYRRYLDDQNSSVPSVVPAPEVPWYLSRAMLGAVATIMAGIAGIAGWAVDATQLAEVLSSAAALCGGILGLVGTLNRKGRIDKTALLPGMRLSHRAAPDANNAAPGWDER